MNKKELVNKTLDIAYYKKQFWLGIALLPLMILLCVTSFFSPQANAVAISLSLLLIIYIPLIVYNAYKIKSFQKDPERYELVEAIAMRAHHAMGMSRGAMYFEVMITAENGEKIYLDTNGVFSRSMFAEHYYKDYCDQRIQILYDRTTGTVLVLDEK